MANKKVSQLTSKPSVLVTDLFPIADPSTGQLYKTTISDLGTAIGSGVSSVNGLVGAVVLDTDDIQELVSPTNKWFTDTRARAALSASSPLAYNSGTGVFSIPAATSSQNGYLTSTDWTTFNNKLSGSGTTNYVPKFTSSDTIGDSNIQVSGSLITLGSNSYVNGNVRIGDTSSFVGVNLRINRDITGSVSSIAQINEGSILSDVTSSAYYFRALLNTQASSFTLSNLYYYSARQNSIGVGSSIITQTGFHVESTLSGATNNYGFRGQIASGTGRFNLYMDGTANNYFAGALGIGSLSLTGYNFRVGQNITGATVAYSIRQDGTIQSDVTSTSYGFSNTLRTAASTFTLASYTHYDAGQAASLGDGSSVTNQYGFYAQSSIIGATNNYGFFGAIPSGTNRWNLYMSGTANNYMFGSLGIGTTSFTGYSLRVNKNPTGATTAYGVSFEGTVQSDVTSGTYGYRTNIATLASSFTTSFIAHYTANQGTIGAGSTVTNQYGFFVGNNLTGATNNYGFFSDVASGTNRWNIYMQGTANNYLAGALSIGVTTADASALFQVDSTTKGVLFPRMTSTQKNAISSPATGLVVFDTTLGKLCVFATTWQTITSL